MAFYRVGEYSLVFWSSRRTSDLDNGIAVAGMLFHEESTGTYRGRAYFQADGTALQPPEESAGGLITLEFNLCQFHAIMEMLRSEAPMYLPKRCRNAAS